MKITYDPQADILCLIFNDADLADADEIEPGVITSYSKDGKLAQLEVLDVSKRSKTPGEVLSIAQE